MSVRLGNCILCEHIAPGLGNKTSLIGVYAGDILVGKFPANLRLAVYIEHIPNDSERYEMAFEIKVGDESVGKGTAEITDAVPNEAALLVLPGINLTTQKEGRFRVLISINGEPPITAIDKAIKDGAVND